MVCILKCFVSRPSPIHLEILLHPNLPSKADVCEKEEEEHKDIFPMVIPRCKLLRVTKCRPAVSAGGCDQRTKRGREELRCVRGQGQRPGGATPRSKEWWLHGGRST